MTFCGERTGLSGICFDRQGLFEGVLLGRDRFAPVGQVFQVHLDRLLCHCDRLLDRAAEGDAAREGLVL